jgi:predicted house-cleaning noncanonical NTP pyrophosphatase (MazG superfamily)
MGGADAVHSAARGRSTYASDVAYERISISPAPGVAAVHAAPRRATVISMPASYRKLVRDPIPEIIQADGGYPVTRILDEVGYRQALLDKLVEEAAEEASASPADLPSELADVLEVLHALTAAAVMSPEQLIARADDKRNDRGG